MKIKATRKDARNRFAGVRPRVSRIESLWHLREFNRMVREEIERIAALRQDPEQSAP